MDAIAEHIVRKQRRSIDKSDPLAAGAPCRHYIVYGGDYADFRRVIRTLRDIKVINSGVWQLPMNNVKHPLERTDSLTYSHLVVVDVIGAHVHDDIFGIGIFQVTFGKHFPVTGSRGAYARAQNVLTCIIFIEITPKSAVKERIAYKQSGRIRYSFIFPFGFITRHFGIVIGRIVIGRTLVYRFRMYGKSRGIIVRRCCYLHVARDKRGDRLFFGVDAYFCFVIRIDERFGILRIFENYIHFRLGISYPGIHVADGQRAVIYKRSYGKSGFVMSCFSRNGNGFAAYKRGNVTVFDFYISACKRI